MSLSTTSRNKLLAGELRDELQIRFTCSNEKLWGSKWGITASVDIDEEKFFEAQHADYRADKVREFYAAWFAAGCATQSAPEASEYVSGGEDEEEISLDEPLTESAHLDSLPDELPEPGLPDIDAMTVAQAAEAIADLPGETLLKLLTVERKGKDRKGVVAAIEKRLDEVLA
jgi:hypothetical protein